MYFCLTSQKMKPLNEKIKELRIAKGFTLRSFAKEVPISFVAYRNIEEGITHPTWDRILRISKILGIDVAELIHAEHNTLKINYEEKFDAMNNKLLEELSLLNNKLDTIIQIISNN